MTSFLKCYLQINLLLFASYFIFRICRTLVSRTNAAVSYQSLTRAAQALLLASLLVPVLFAMVSEKSLSHLTFVAIRPASESASPGQAQKKNIQIHRALPVTAGVPDDDRFTLQAMMKSLSSAMT
jgi:hypothetical protein